MFLKCKSKKKILCNKLILAITILCKIQLFTANTQQGDFNVNSMPGDPPNVPPGPVVNPSFANNNLQTMPSAAMPKVNTGNLSQAPGTNNGYYYPGSAATSHEGSSNQFNYNPNGYNSPMNSNYQNPPNTYSNYQTNPSYPAQNPYSSNLYAPTNNQPPIFPQGYAQQPTYNSYSGQKDPLFSGSYNTPPVNYNSAYVANNQPSPYAPPSSYIGQNNYPNNPATSTDYYPTVNRNQWQGSNSQNYVTNGQNLGQQGLNYGNNPTVGQSGFNYESNPLGNQLPASTYNTAPQNLAYGPRSNGYGVPTNTNRMQVQSTNGKSCLNQLDNDLCSQYAEQGLCAQYGPQCDASCSPC